MTSFSEGNINRDATGKFAAKTTSETDADVLNGYDSPSADTVLAAHGDELDQYVRHPDVSVRVAAAANPHLSKDQVNYLSDPNTQPAVVRLEVARSGAPAAPDALAHDPSPTVRAFASLQWNAADRVQSSPSDRAVQSALGLGVASASS